MPHIQTTYGTNAYIQLEMWKNIYQQLEALKLDSVRITKYVQKQICS